MRIDSALSDTLRRNNANNACIIVSGSDVMVHRRVIKILSALTATLAIAENGLAVETISDAFPSSVDLLGSPANTLSDEDSTYIPKIGVIAVDDAAGRVLSAPTGKCRPSPYSNRKRMTGALHYDL